MTESWRPDLLSLRQFVVVYEERSLSRAVEAESTVVSAISKRISEMERLAGAQLLVREPTPAGLAMVARARQILCAADLLRSELQEHASGRRCQVRMLAAVSAGLEWLPHDVSSFLGDYPGTEVEILEETTPSIIDCVHSGEAGLGFASAAIHELHQTPYATSRLAAVMHRTHPLAARKSVGFSELLGMEFVALSRNSGTTRLLSSIAAREGREISYRLFAATLDTAFRVIVEGHVVGIFGEAAIHAFEDRLALAAVPLEEEWATHDLVLYARAPDLLSPSARAFTAHLR
jgi:DNA-binding transcriptional LysR family regulator